MPGFAKFLLPPTDIGLIEVLVDVHFRMPEWSLYAHAGAVHREAVGMAEHDESCVSQTLPLVFKLWAVGPEELKDLPVLRGQLHPDAVQKPPVTLTSPICNLAKGPIW